MNQNGASPGESSFDWNELRSKAAFILFIIGIVLNLVPLLFVMFFSYYFLSEMLDIHPLFCYIACTLIGGFSIYMLIKLPVIRIIYFLLSGIIMTLSLWSEVTRKNDYIWGTFTGVCVASVSLLVVLLLFLKYSDD